MTRRRVVLALLVAWGLAPTSAASPDSLVVFRSGKTMRVASHREEGQWVFLTVSPRSNPKDEPSEIGVLKDSILRYETPQVSSGPIDPGPSGAGQAANGVVHEMTEADGLAAAMSTRPGGPSMDEAKQQLDSIPAAGTLEGNQALVEDSLAAGVPLAGGSGGGGPEWNIDPEKSGAGSVIRAPLRNMKMSKKYIDRARQLWEQQQAAKAAAAAQGAAAGTPSGETPPPPPQSPQP